MPDGRIIRKQSACVGQLAVAIPHFKGIKQLFLHAVACPSLVAFTQLGKGIVFEIVLGIQRIISAVHTLEKKLIQYIRRGNHAFVANTDICFRNAVCLVIIGRGASCGNGQHKNILAIIPFGSEDKVRIWRDTFLNQAADRLCIGLCVSQAYYVSVIINAEKECAADTVGKGTDTFEPAFRLFNFQSNLEIAFRCFCNPSIYHKFVSFPIIPSFPSFCSYKHYTYSCTAGCRRSHSVCLPQRSANNACIYGWASPCRSA